MCTVLCVCALCTIDKRMDAWSEPSCIYTQIGFSPIRILSKFFLTFVYLYSIQLFSADPELFSKKFWINFLSIKFLKNWPQKLLIISPNPFISQSSPDHKPRPKIDFSYYEISGPDICSLHTVREWIYIGHKLPRIFDSSLSIYDLNAYKKCLKK